MAVRYIKNTQRNFCRFKLSILVTVLEDMTMGGENKNKPRIDPQILMGDYLGLSIAGIVAMIIVWLTMTIPESRKTQSEKFCYHYCITETDKKMEGKYTSGPRYITNLRGCYQDCIKEENKAKNEKNTNKDASH